MSTTKAGSQDGLDMRHGANCPKVEHETRRRYMHASDDDSPYDVDGVSYCGRCHHVMPHISVLNDSPSQYPGSNQPA